MGEARIVSGIGLPEELRVEKAEKETSQESMAARKAADMDSICEEISRAIVEGLVEKEILDEPPVTHGAQSMIAETAVIAPIDDVGAETAACSVQTLLESDAISAQIIRLVQEKVEQVLDEDLRQSRRGDSGLLAERLHLECAQLFERESFRGEILGLLRQDLMRSVVPAITQDVREYVKHTLTAVTQMLTDKLVEVLARARAVQCGGTGAPVAPAAAPAGQTAAAGGPNVPEAPAVAPRPAQSVPHATPPAAAERYRRIRERLWWDGVL